MPVNLASPAAFEPPGLHRNVNDQLLELEDLARELMQGDEPPLLTPDLAELREDVAQLAIQLAISDSGHLVNSVSNIEHYLREDPGAALHHLRELRRRLLFHHWPIARRLHEMIQDLERVEKLLEANRTEHVAAVLDDLDHSKHFRKFVPPEHQPDLVAYCIEAGILYSEDPKAALRGYLLHEVAQVS